MRHFKLIIAFGVATRSSDDGTRAGCASTSASDTLDAMHSKPLSACSNEHFSAVRTRACVPMAGGPDDPGVLSGRLRVCGHARASTGGGGGAQEERGRGLHCRHARQEAHRRQGNLRLVLIAAVQRVIARVSGKVGGAALAVCGVVA
jgi:hypothetical protein